jgi:hypothetical protein
MGHSKHCRQIKFKILIRKIGDFLLNFCSMFVELKYYSTFVELILNT